MKKNVLFVIIAIFSIQNIFAQKVFDFTIVLDKTIDAKEISCNYFDGKNTIAVTDTFHNNEIEIKEPFYSLEVSFNINYNSNSKEYTNSFFLNEKPAKAALYFSPDDADGNLKYSSLINAQPIFDTTTNTEYKNLLRYRIKEATAVSDLWKEHGAEIFHNDSITLLMHKLYKALNERTMLFFKKYPENYFSFWYFRDQVVDPSLIFFPRDTAYLKRLVFYIKTVFPVKYTESIEGKDLTKHIEGLIDSPGLNDYAPEFTFRDINGNQVDLNDCKSEYVLLDFWATWCPPCIQALPFIQEIRKENSSFRLTIISISQDRDSAELKKAVKKYGMNWTNILDRENEIGKLYGVVAIPTLFVIDSKGKIVYKSGSGEDDKKKLLNILK